MLTSEAWYVRIVYYYDLLVSIILDPRGWIARIEAER